MYCKTCGHQNPDSAHYCENDGTLLSKSNIKLKANGQAQFCPDCGTKALSNQAYCLSCGHSLAKYYKEKTIPLPLPKLDSESIKTTATVIKTKASSFKIPAFNLDYFKKALIPIIISFVILLAIGFATLSYVDDFMNNMIGEQMDEMDMDLDDLMYLLEEETADDLPELDKIIGISDMIMLSNMQDSTFVMEVKGSYGGDFEQAKGSIAIENGSFIYLLFAFLALFAGGIVMGVMNKDSKHNPLQSALTFGVSYAVILSVFSLFAGYSYKNTFSDESMNFTIKLANEYSFFSSLFWGFVLAFTISGLGLLFSINYRKITGNLRHFTPYGEAVHQAFSTVVRGGLVVFLFLFITLYNKVEELKNALMFNPLPISLGEILEKSFMLVTTMSVQFSNYLWNLLHFAPLTFKGGEGLEVGEVTFSAFGGFNTDGAASNADLDTLGYFITSLDMDTYLKLAFILPLALFVWAGYQIAQNPEKMIPKVAVFSVAYALLMTVLASFSDIGFSMELMAIDDSPNKMEMTFGFSLFNLFFSSLVFSFVGAYGGTWVRILRK